jgi:two-component system, cell cycle response regulator
MQIIVADDDAISRIILRTAVEQLGHTCLEAENGAQAWELLQQHDVDVVISDRVMPEMDGLELCRLMRHAPAYSHTYFIFLTMLQERRQLLDGILAGADDYLVKPLDHSELQVRLIVAERVSALHHRAEQQQTELLRLNEQLFAQARTDPLTQLSNRLRLREDLDALAAQIARYANRSYAAVMCDIDRFKSYNDYYGHLAGDEVLRRVAATLVASCRAGDRAYRYGGEEFLLLLPEQPPATALGVIERIRQAVERLAIAHELNQPGRVVTISAGVAPLACAEARTVYDGLRAADVALYQAKTSGRNCTVVFETSDCCV